MRSTNYKSFQLEFLVLVSVGDVRKVDVPAQLDVLHYTTNIAAIVGFDDNPVADGVEEEERGDTDQSLSCDTHATSGFRTRDENLNWTNFYEKSLFCFKSS